MQFSNEDEISDNDETVPFLSKKQAKLDTTVLLFLFSIIPMMLFGFIFTDMGKGATIFRALTGVNGVVKFVIVLCIVLFVVAIYLFDISDWPNGLKGITIFLIICCLCVVALMSAATYPAFPMSLFLILLPVYYWALYHGFLIKYNVISKVDKNHYLLSFLHRLSFAVFAIGFVSFIVWISWAASTSNWWTEEKRKDYVEDLNCQEEYCGAAFLFFWGGLIVACFVMVFAVIVYLFSKSLMFRRHEDKNTNKNLELSIKILLFSFFLLFIGTWVAAAIEGAQTKLANVVMTFAFCISAASVLVVGSVYGWTHLMNDLKNSKRFRKLHHIVMSDWMLAMGGLILFAPICIFVLLSMLNNQIRKFQVFPCVDNKDKKNNGLLTKRVNLQIENLWTKRNKSSILNKMMIIAYVLVSIQVLLGKVVNIFLAWILEQLVDVPGGLPVQTIIFMFIGMSMFLIPAIPGGPVYIAGGILLVNSAWIEFHGNSHDYKNDEAAFWIAVIYSSIICLIIKFAAIAFEQKLIGEKLGEKVWVRLMIGINSPHMRAIEKILEKPGLDIAKMSVLVGGPDWPTSVITGILKQKLSQMLLGSLPVVIFYIFPSVIAGGFMLRTESPWTTLAPISLSIAAGLNVAGPTLAVYFLEKTVNDHYEELSKKEPDVEVLKLEREKYLKLALHDGWSNWEGLNVLQKVLMFVAVLSMVITVYLFFGVGSKCFYSFQVTTNLKKEFGKDATVFSVVKTLGWVGLGLNLFSVVLYKILGFLKNRNTKHTVDKFDFETLKKDFQDLYDKFVIVEYNDIMKKNKGKIEGSFDKPIKQFLVELFNNIMTKSFKEYLKVENSEITYRSKFNFTVTQLEDRIRKSESKILEMHLLEASQKMVASLRSNKVWVKQNELESPKVKADFVSLMTANFCVIVHQFKRKIKRENLKTAVGT